MIALRSAARRHGTPAAEVRRQFEAVQQIEWALLEAWAEIRNPEGGRGE